MTDDKKKNKKDGDGYSRPSNGTMNIQKDHNKKDGKKESGD